MTAAATKNKFENPLLHCGMLIAAVLLAYAKVFHAGFASWDDGEYVLHNNDIRGLDPANIRAWFSGFYVGNYHPLTMLSYAVDFLIGKQQPLVYHLTNILLHAFNACLVYRFIKKLQPNAVVAVFVALLFAVHPVQTESVSWIAERKTVLAALCYLLALIQYTKYVTDPSGKRMASVFLWGLAAMLSKGTAVTLPLSLFAVDIWMQRTGNGRKMLMEKLPLLVLSAITGLVALKAQASSQFLDRHAAYGLWDTLVYAGYAYVQYIVHFFVPLRLSVMYPYPQSAGVLHYLFFAFALAMIPLGAVAWCRRWHVLCGGILFYTANIVIVLQFIQFGESLMADRYLYIACIGLLYPAAYYLVGWLQLKGRQAAGIAATGLIGVVFLAMTFFRNDIWLSDINFFNAMLDAFPESAVAQYSVGAELMKLGRYDEAELHLDKAVRIDPNSYKAWHNKGALHLRQGRPMEALDALNRSIAINDYYKAYFTRAMLHEGSGKPDLAIADIDKVLTVQPQNARAYYIKADCQEKMGNGRNAMDNYTHAILYDGNEPLFFIRRGLLYSKMKQNPAAINDLNAAVDLNPANGEALYYRGIVKSQSGLSPCSDLQSALQHGYKQAQEALARMCNK